MFRKCAMVLVVAAMSVTPAWGRQRPNPAQTQEAPRTEPGAPVREEVAGPAAKAGVRTGDVILSERTVGPLATGGSSAGSHPVVIPAGTAAGAYYLIAVADATGLVAETRETNNKKPKPLTITP